MLMRKWLDYAIGSGVPGLVNFLAVALYTRLLAPAEYGRYALVLAGVAIANAILFQWLRAAVRRLLIAGDRAAILGTVRRLFLLIVTGAVAASAAAILLLEDPWPRLVPLGAVLLVAQAWFELNQDVQLVDLRSVGYGVAQFARATIGVVVGATLAAAGAGAAGVLLGLILGYAVPGAVLGLRQFRAAVPLAADVRARVLAYGLPLAAGYALQFVLDSSDRFLLGWLASTASVGAYAVAYDLAQQSLGLLMIVVNMAAYPLALLALEREGPTAARRPLAQHAELLAAVSVPATVGLVLLSRPVADVALGAAFRDEAARLMPIVALGALLGGWKAFYFDLAFQFAQRTSTIVWIGLAGAVTNAGLNLVLIPLHGAAGAAWATVATFALVLALSAGLGRRVFGLPLPMERWARVALATAAMAVVLVGLRRVPGVAGLLLGVAGGGVAYALAAVSLDVAGSRALVARALPER